MAQGGVRQRTRIRPTVTVAGTGTGPAGPNQAPIWLTVGNFTFTEGIPDVFSVASKVSDPGGSVASVVVQSGVLPTPRLTFNTSTFEYVYNGGAGSLPQTSYRLAATDNLGATSFSNFHSLTITAISFATPAPIYTAGTIGDYPLVGLIPSFDASRDVITRDASGVAFPAWMTLTGPGGSILHADGTQTGTSGFPNLVLKVTRGGSASAITTPFTVVVNPVVTAFTWVQLHTGIDQLGHPGSYGSAIERTGTGRLFLYFDRMDSFNFATGRWTNLGGINRRENAYYAHDPVNNVLWSPDCLQVTNPAFSNTVYWDPVTNTMTAPSVPNGPPGQSGGGYDPNTQRLVAFGGYSAWPAGGLKVLSIPNRTPTGWVNMSPSGPQPIIQDVGKEADYTSLRGGVDSRDGAAWVLADGREFSRWEPTTNKWSLIPTTGTKPLEFCVASLNERRNVIVAHTGINEIQENLFIPGRETRVLDLATLNWSLAITGTSGNPPFNAAQIQQHLDYDYSRGKTIWNAYNSNTAGQDVWEFAFSTTEDLTIPTRTFVARFGTGSAVGESIWATGFGIGLVEKHVVFTNDHLRKKVVCFGGDYFGLQWAVSNTSAANQEIYGYNAKSNTWHMVSPMGRGPGTFSPDHPNDAQFFVHDTKRDRYWTGPGIWFPTSHGSVISNIYTASPGQNVGGVVYNGIQSTGGGTRFEGLLWCNPVTGAWTPVTNSNIDSPVASPGTAILNGYQGCYDPVQDAIITIGGDTDMRVERLFLNDNPSLITRSVVTVPYDQSGGTRQVADAFQQQPAFDILGRKIYLITSVINLSTGFPVEWRIWSIDMDTPAAGATMLATPPAALGLQTPDVFGPNSCFAMFDTTNRKVIWPKLNHLENFGHQVIKMGVYSPATNTWEAFDPTCDTPAAGIPYGDTWVYDETHNCVIGGGSNDNLQAQPYFFLWRYA